MLLTRAVTYAEVWFDIMMKETRGSLVKSQEEEGKHESMLRRTQSLSRGSLVPWEVL